MTPGILYRDLRTREDFQRCVEIQKETWGDTFTELVPPGLLAVVRKTGGIVVGAFLGGDDMVGFVFSFVGLRDGRPIQWSHMLAVVPEARGFGVGRSLKLRQRQRALERGLDRILWTFDPLQARNAHLNVNRLGVHVIEYVPDMYGEDTGSRLHGGGATDRLIVEWRLNDARTRAALDGHAGDHHGTAGDGIPVIEHGDRDFPDADEVWIHIPDRFLDLAASDPKAAAAWREGTRRSFRHYFGRGYRVEAFRRSRPDPGAPAECHYVLRSAPATEGGASQS